MPRRRRRRAAEPVFLPSPARSGFLPDLASLDEALLRRTVALYLCSPSNPQGAVAERALSRRAIGLARAHDFLLFADECYSEIYVAAPAPGRARDGGCASGRPCQCRRLPVAVEAFRPAGAEIGLCRRRPEFIAAFGRFRNVACPQMPLPIQHASVAAWVDEAHVEQGRARYRQNFAIADEVLRAGTAIGARRAPSSSGSISAHSGGGEAAAKTLWKDCGVKVLPGTYLAQAGQTAAIRARTMSGSPSCMTLTPRARL